MIQIPTSISTEFVLDTNAAIDFLNKPAIAAAKVGAAAKVSVPITVLGELFYGAEKSKKVSANLLKVEDLIHRTRVLPCDLETARRYGHIRHFLRLKGRPIPHEDMWIAAAALQHNLPLLTADTHFDDVENLQVVRL